MNEDVRWKQRYDNYRKSLTLLEECMPDDVSAANDMQRLAITQAFEMVYELGWKTMRDFMQEQGADGMDINFPKKVIRYAVNFRLIDEGQVWMDAIEARNKTSHIYDEAVVKKLMLDVHGKFLPVFRALDAQLQSHYEQQSS